MTQLFDKIARAYRAGGISEVTRRGYVKYLQPRMRVNSLYFHYYFKKKQEQLETLVTELERADVGTRLTKSDLMPHKTSDTIFILGSGESINKITDKQWKIIDRHDSIGLNRWPVHEFVPTYYSFELPKRGYNEMRQAFLNLLEYRKEDYCDTPMIIKDITRMQGMIRNSNIESYTCGELLLSRDSNFPKIPTNTRAHRRLLQWLASRGHFFNQDFGLLYRRCGSVSYLIHLAVLLGYETIVLCGVDMINSKYFFMSDQYRESNIPIPEPETTDTNKTHRTNDPNRGPRMKLEDIIYLIDDIILQPNDIELYVENDISALHPRVPLYSYE